MMKIYIDSINISLELHWCYWFEVCTMTFGYLDVMKIPTNFMFVLVVITKGSVCRYAGFKVRVDEVQNSFVCLS